MSYAGALTSMRHSRLLQILLLLVRADLFAAHAFPLLPVFADEVLGVRETGFGLMMAALSVAAITRKEPRSGHPPLPRQHLLLGQYAFRVGLDA